MSGEVSAFDITPEKNGGVLKEIIKEGEGEMRPPNGVKTKVHYTGRLQDGTVFDSSKDRGEPFEFNLGRGNVIQGWDVGVATMKKGEVCFLTCREDYAYGKAGSPPKIPPDATLVFEVELLDWEPENLSGKRDNGILRHPISVGTGIDSPKDGARVEVTLVGEMEGKEFFNERVSFDLGEGITRNVPPGIEKALEKMVVNEKSRIVLKPSYGWGSEGCPALGVPPNTPLSYTVTLHSFDIVKDSWMLTSTEKLKRGNELKEKGTNYLKEGNLSLAIKMYNKLVELVNFAGGFENEEEERKKLLVAGYLNLSMVYLKLEDNVQCKDMCDKALDEDQDSVKALFRRGQAFLGMNEPQLARSDFQRVLDLEPNNKAAMNQLTTCQRKATEIKQQEKRIYANMFDKFAKKDREWRFGWWDQNKPNVEEDEGPSMEEMALKDRQKELERKRKFLEQRAKLLKEREAERKEGAAESDGGVVGGGGDAAEGTGTPQAPVAPLETEPLNTSQEPDTTERRGEGQEGN